MRNILNMSYRSFAAGYNYSAASNPRVFMDVSNNGASAGRLVFELFENHAPANATNFAAFCNGTASGHRALAGTSLGQGLSGFGVHGGFLGGENVGAADERVADEDLHVRHHKRGMLTMLNDGPHSNGSQFLVTFGEAHYLDGY